MSFPTTGQMTSGSLALLVKLSCGSAGSTGRVQWRQLTHFSCQYAVNLDDLQPLVAAGWLDEHRGKNDSLAISITDAGNEVVRGLVEWMRMTATKGGVA